MKLLITGGSGMVGYGLKNIIKDSDYETIFMSSKMCDLTNEKATIDFFMKENLILLYI